MDSISSPLIPSEHGTSKYSGDLDIIERLKKLTKAGIAVDPTSYLAPRSTALAPKEKTPVSDSIDNLVGVFSKYVDSYEPVGSRVTCDPAPTDTDEDFLLLTCYVAPLIKECKALGFEGGEVYFDSAGEASSNFYSLKKGDINLIITEKQSFYDKFLLASHVCKTLNVLDKQHRITVFQAILYEKKHKPKLEGKP
jgi:hypothetical protein